MYEHQDRLFKPVSRLDGSFPVDAMLQPGMAGPDDGMALGFLGDLGRPTLQVQAVPAGQGGIADYLDAQIVARGVVTLPTADVGFVLGVNHWWNDWPRRLWKDPALLYPEARVTIELFRVGPSLTPIGFYRAGTIWDDALHEHLMRGFRKPPCSRDFAPVAGLSATFSTKANLEKQLKLPNQFDVLLQAARIPIPVSSVDANRHGFIVSVAFPLAIKQYVIDEAKAVIDGFDFDKDVLKQEHRDKIAAVARQIVAVTARMSSARAMDPRGAPKIALAGHTDIRGTERYNDGLGDRRAVAVETALKQSIDAMVPGFSGKLSIARQSLGETKPRIKATTEPQHALNRRVEVSLTVSPPRCRRLPLKVVLKRGTGLLGRLAAPQAKRIRCLLEKATRPGGDDRWIDSTRILAVEQGVKKFGSYGFSNLRDSLSSTDLFGPAVSDVQFLAWLQKMDEELQASIDTMVKRISLLSGAANQGINAQGLFKAMDDLRAWMDARAKDDSSIYSCYR
jgi:outer membrane protein OmpA-like peptidoglycan-associated protein